MMDFQTPPPVCDYMVNLCLGWVGKPHFLEPTPGQGNIVAAIKRQYPDSLVTVPDDFFSLVPGIFSGLTEYPRFHQVIMNPPFSPIISGWKFLKHCMKMSDHIVCLLPWFIILNSAKRLKTLQEFGLASLTYLPRETFPKSRVQCCIYELRPWKGQQTIFKTFQF